MVAIGESEKCNRSTVVVFKINSVSYINTIHMLSFLRLLVIQLFNVRVCILLKSVHIGCVDTSFNLIGDLMTPFPLV